MELRVLLKWVAVILLENLQHVNSNLQILGCCKHLAGKKVLLFLLLLLPAFAAARGGWGGAGSLGDDGGCGRLKEGAKG
jgi:hypothetical protein